MREISRITGSPSTYFNSILRSEMPGRTCWRACCPLRMRVSISPSGSLIDMACLPSPARFGHAGDLPGRGQLAHRDARQPELAVIAARPAGQGAAVAQPGLRAVARHLGQLQLRLEAVFRRRIAVAGDRLEAHPARCQLLGQLGAAGVFLDRAFLGHGSIRNSAEGQLVNGMSKALSSALASASVFAVVTMTTSIPRT